MSNVRLKFLQFQGVILLSLKRDGSALFCARWYEAADPMAHSQSHSSRVLLLATNAMRTSSNEHLNTCFKKLADAPTSAALSEGHTWKRARTAIQSIGWKKTVSESTRTGAKSMIYSILTTSVRGKQSERDRQYGPHGTQSREVKVSTTR